MKGELRCRRKRLLTMLCPEGNCVLHAANPKNNGPREIAWQHDGMRQSQLALAQLHRGGGTHSRPPAEAAQAHRPPRLPRTQAGRKGHGTESAGVRRGTVRSGRTDAGRSAPGRTPRRAEHRTAGRATHGTPARVARRAGRRAARNAPGTSAPRSRSRRRVIAPPRRRIGTEARQSRSQAPAWPTRGATPAPPHDAQHSLPAARHTDRDHAAGRCRGTGPTNARPPQRIGTPLPQ